MFDGIEKLNKLFNAALRLKRGATAAFQCGLRDAGSAESAEATAAVARWSAAEADHVRRLTERSPQLAPVFAKRRTSLETRLAAA